MNFPSPSESSAMGWGKRGGGIRRGGGKAEWQQERDGGRSRIEDGRDPWKEDKIEPGGRVNARGEKKIMQNGCLVFAEMY